jgi:glutaredoxin
VPHLPQRRARLALGLLCALLATGCERPGGASRAAEGAPEARSFRVDARGIYYHYRDESAGLRKALELERVPLSKRGATIVESIHWDRSSSQRRALLESSVDSGTTVYVADLLDATPGEKRRARRRTLGYIRAASLAGEWGELHGRLAEVRARRMADFHPDSPRQRSARQALQMLHDVERESQEMRRDAIDRLALECRPPASTSASDSSSGGDAPDAGGDEERRAARVGQDVPVEGNGDIATHLRMQYMARYRPVVMYCATTCDTCERAAVWIAERGIPFRRVMVDEDLGHKMGLVEAARAANLSPATVPFFRIGARTMQGWDPQTFLRLTDRKRQP